MMSSVRNLSLIIQIFIFFYSLMLVYTTTPGGDNTCLEEESFNVTIQVTETFPQEYRDSKWCLSIPPRCTVYKIRYVTRTVPKVITNTREVYKCCSGYLESLDGECKASCEEPCRHGACTRPNTCSCFPGFKGRLCQELCSRRTWGRNCTQQCECQNGSFCNPMNGSCICPPGWRGPRCGEPCKDGYFGMDCRLPCYCLMGENLSCHHITGECIIPTTTELDITTELTTEVPTTTETITTTELLTTTETVTTTEMPSTAEITTTTEIPTTTETITTATELITTTELSALTDSLATTETLSTTKIFANELYFSTIPPTSSPSDSTSTDLNSSNFTKNNYPNSTIFNQTRNTDQVTEMPGIEYQNNMEIARLAITITLSVLGSLILLFAAAGLALSKHRKIPTENPNTSDIDIGDIGLYTCCPEGPQPVPPAHVMIPNPSYGFGHYETALESAHFPTFKINEESLEVEIRDMLEERYDYPVSSASFDHVYAEINSAAGKHIYKNI